MKPIFETQYVKAFWLADLNTVVYRWLPANEAMTSEDYQNEMLNILDKAMKVYQPANVVVNARESRFIVLPELQKWVAASIIKPAITFGLKRGFFVTNEDLIMQLVYEQVAEEDPNIPYHHYHLNSEDEALQLIEKMC